MLEHIDDHHEIEALRGEGKTLPLDLADSASDQVANRRHGLPRQIGAHPTPTAPAEEVADHAIVGPQVEATLSRRIGKHGIERAVLGLLEYRFSEELQRGGFVAHSPSGRA